MAVSLVLRVLTAPLTQNHLIAVLNISSGSGFGATEHRDRLGADHSTATALDSRIAFFHERAVAAIATDMAFQADLDAFLAKQSFPEAGRAVIKRSPKMQFFAMAPSLYLCEDIDTKDQAIFDLVETPFHLSTLNRGHLMGAFVHSTRTDKKTLVDAGEFLDTYYGHQAIITRD